MNAEGRARHEVGNEGGLAVTAITLEAKLELDLSLVDPERREEVARRIVEVEEYLKAPGRVAAELAAARLGLRISMFLNLVRTWKNDPRAERLAGATRRRSTPRRTDGPTPAQLAVIRGTEAEMPDDMLLGRVVKQIYANADSLGAAMPSRPTVQAYAAKFRRSRLAGLPSGVGIAIDHCAVDVPVRWRNATVMPLATVVLDLESRRVIGATLDPVAPGPRTTALALLDAVARIERVADEPTGEIPVEIDRDSRPEWSELLRIVDANGLNRSGRDAERLPGGMRTIRLMGKDVNGVRFRARMTHKAPEERIRTGFAAEIHDAQQFVRARLIGSTTGGPLGRLTERVRTTFALDLRRFAGR